MKTRDEYVLEREELFKKKNILDRQLTRVANAIQKIDNERATEYIKTIPKDPKKITKKQWGWILSRDHGEPQVQYDFCRKFLEDLGLNAFGFQPESKQWLISIYHYGFKKDVFKKTFLLIKDHLKDVTIVDRRHGEETGIRMTVSIPNEDEGCTSVVYYKRKTDKIHLYSNEYSNKARIFTFDEFLDWYERRILAANDDD